MPRDENVEQTQRRLREEAEERLREERERVSQELRGEQPQPQPQPTQQPPLWPGPRSPDSGPIIPPVPGQSPAEALVSSFQEGPAAPAERPHDPLEPYWRARLEMARIESDVPPITLADEKMAWRQRHDTPIWGTLVNFLDGLYENVQGIVGLVALNWKALWNIVTDPVGSAEWVKRPPGGGGLLDLGWAMIKGYGQDLANQYGGGTPLLHQLQYYPYETTLDVLTLFWGLGGALRLGAKLGGVSKIAEATRAAGVPLTRYESQLVRMNEFGERLQRLSTAPGRAAWDVYRDIWHEIPQLRRLQAVSGFGPRSKPQDIALRALADADRRAAVRSQALADDLSRTEGFKEVFTLTEELREMRKVADDIAAGKSVSPEKKARYDALRAKELERFKAVHLGEGWNRLSEPEKAYFRELKRQEIALANSELEYGQITHGAFYSVPVDLAVKYRKDASELRAHLASKFQNVSAKKLEMYGFAKYRDHPSIKEMAQEVQLWVNRTEGDEVPLLYHHIVYDPDSKAMKSIFDWHTSKQLATGMFRRRHGLPPSIEDLMPVNFHDAWVRTYLAKIKHQEYTKAIAELLDPKGPFRKYAREMAHPHDLRPGEAPMPGAALMAIARHKDEAYEALLRAMQTPIREGRSALTERSLRSAVDEYVNRMFSDPGKLERMQREFLGGLGTQLYAVPEDVAYVMSRYINPPNSPLLTAVDRFNSIMKLSILSMNPAWYAQAVLGGALQSFLATGELTPGPRLYLRLRKQLAGIPAEFQGVLRGVVDEAVRAIEPDDGLSRALKIAAFPYGLRQRLATWQNWIDDFWRATTFEKVALREIQRLIKEGTLKVGEAQIKALEKMRVVFAGPANAPIIANLEEALVKAGYNGTLEDLGKILASGGPEAAEWERKLGPELAAAARGERRVPTVEEMHLEALRVAKEKHTLELIKLQRAAAQRLRLVSEVEAKKAKAAVAAKPKQPVKAEAKKPPPSPPPPPLEEEMKALIARGAEVALSTLPYEELRRSHTVAALTSLRRANAIPGHKMIRVGDKVAAIPRDPLLLGMLSIMDRERYKIYTQLRRAFWEANIPPRGPATADIDVVTELLLEKRAGLRRRGESVRDVLLKQVDEGGVEINVTELRKKHMEGLERAVAAEREAEELLEKAGRGGLRPEEEIRKAKIPTNPMPEPTEELIKMLEQDILSGRKVNVSKYRQALIEAMLPEDIRKVLRGDPVKRHIEMTAETEGIRGWEATALSGYALPAPAPPLSRAMLQKSAEYVPSGKKWTVAQEEFIRRHNREIDKVSEWFMRKVAENLRGRYREHMEQWRKAGLSLLDRKRVRAIVKDYVERGLVSREALRAADKRRLAAARNLPKGLSRYERTQKLVDIDMAWFRDISGALREGFREHFREFGRFVAYHKRPWDRTLFVSSQQYYDKSAEFAADAIKRGLLDKGVHRKQFNKYREALESVQKRLRAEAEKLGLRPRVAGSQAPSKGPRPPRGYQKGLTQEEYEKLRAKDVQEPPSKRERQRDPDARREQEAMERRELRSIEEQEELLERISTVLADEKVNRLLNAFLFGRRRGSRLLKKQLALGPEAAARLETAAPSFFEEIKRHSDRVLSPIPEVVDAFQDAAHMTRAYREAMTEAAGAKRAAKDDILRHISQEKAAETELERLTKDIEEISSRVNAAEPLARAWDEAYRAVNDFHFNYFNLHPFHRMYVRQIVPFWSWYYSIGKMAFMSTFRHPQRVKLLHDVGRLALEAQYDPDAPEWLRDYVPIGVFVDSGTGDRELLMMNVSSWDPRASVIMDEFSIASRLHPFIVAAIEWADGKDLLTRKPLRPGTVVDPATGTLMQFDPRTGAIRPRPAFSAADVPEVALRLFESLPAGYILSTLQRPYTITEKTLKGSTLRVGDLDSGISAIGFARWMESIFRLRATNTKNLRARANLERAMRTRIYSLAQRYLKSIDLRGAHPWGRNEDRKAVRELLDDIERSRAKKRLEAE